MPACLNTILNPTSKSLSISPVKEFYQTCNTPSFLSSLQSKWQLNGRFTAEFTSRRGYHSCRLDAITFIWLVATWRYDPMSFAISYFVYSFYTSIGMDREYFSGYVHNPTEG